MRTNYTAMFGAPQLSEEEKKIHQQQTNNTIKVSLYIATALWVTPIVYHFIKKQL